MMVLDASALLCYLQLETGFDAVRAHLSQAHMSTVNWSEVVQKSMDKNKPVALFKPKLLTLGLTIHPFTDADAEEAARLKKLTQPFGLSLADRACLALAKRLKSNVLTSDTDWAKIKPLPFEVHFFR